MAVRVRAAASVDLKEGVPVYREVSGRGLVVVRYQGVVRALDDVCPHRGGPMHQGEVREGCIECPLHGWAFSLHTGEMPEQPGFRLELFEVVEEGGEVFVEVPPT